MSCAHTVTVPLPDEQAVERTRAVLAERRGCLRPAAERDGPGPDGDRARIPEEASAEEPLRGQA